MVDNTTDVVLFVISLFCIVLVSSLNHPVDLKLEPLCTFRNQTIFLYTRIDQEPTPTSTQELALEHAWSCQCVRGAALR